LFVQALAARPELVKLKDAVKAAQTELTEAQAAAAKASKAAAASKDGKVKQAAEKVLYIYI